MRRVASSARREEGVGWAPTTDEQRRDAPQIGAAATKGKPVGALWLALGPLLLFSPACNACGSEDGALAAERAGRAHGTGIAHALGAAEGLSEPFRCANVTAKPPESLVFERAGSRQVRLDGRTLVLGAEDRTAVIGVVADARGVSDRTATQLRRIRERFVREKAELVLSLGGLGTGREELARALEILSDGPWVTLALPGDRERVRDHAAAIEDLARDGRALVDGSAIRFAELDGAVVATFPGVAGASRLVSGADGCVHDAADAHALAALLAARPGARVWAAYAPPRQRGGGGSDLAAGAVHVGDPSLSAPIAESGAHVVVSALVDEAVLDARGGRRDLADGERLFLAAGAAEAVPVGTGSERQVAAKPGSATTRVGGAALLLRISPTRKGARIRWERVLFDVGELTAAP